MATSFEFKVSDPQVRKPTQKMVNFSYYVYNVHATVSHPRYPHKVLDVMRRYSDFEWLHNRLSQEYPFLIIPPIPEKDFNKSKSDQHLLEYRQRALWQFLSRVGHHHTLCDSKDLRDFLEQDEQAWATTMAAPHKADPEQNIAAALDHASKILNRQMGPNAPQESDVKALQEPLSRRADWKATEAYIKLLQDSLLALQKRLLLLASRRRDTSAALCEFGRCFQNVGKAEEALESAESAATPNNLSTVIKSVGTHADNISRTYATQADEETRSVIESVMYYVRLCGSVQDCLGRLLTEIDKQESLTHKLADLNHKKRTEKSPEKMRKIEQEIENVDEQLRKQDNYLKSFQRVFKVELRRFHVEKQYDMKATLKKFTDLQVGYSDKMKRAWEDLLPSVERVNI